MLHAEGSEMLGLDFRNTCGQNGRPDTRLETDKDVNANGGASGYCLAKVDLRRSVLQCLWARRDDERNIEFALRGPPTRLIP